MYPTTKPPYKCNWCGEDLHGRYGRAIYRDYDGKDYCSEYCFYTMIEVKKDDEDIDNCSNYA